MTTSISNAVDTGVLSRYRRVADYLAAAMIFLQDNVLLREPLRAEHLKPRLLGLGMTEEDFTGLFGTDVPVVFAFHGYPSAMHEVLHGRTDPNRFHVHGYLEEGTTTTPYDLLMANAMSCHDLAAHAVSLAPGWSSQGGDIADDLLRERDELVAHAYRTGADPDAFTDWTWTS